MCQACQPEKSNVTAVWKNNQSLARKKIYVHSRVLILTETYIDKDMRMTPSCFQQGDKIDGAAAASYSFISTKWRTAMERAIIIRQLLIIFCVTSE